MSRYSSLYRLKHRCVKSLLLFFIAVLSFFQFAGSSLFAQSQSTYARFARGFKTPPPEAHPIVYHWWLGGNVDTVRLKEELVSFRNAGIGGFTIFEIGSRDTLHVKQGPAYLSNESLASIKFAVTEAGKLGLTVGLNTASSWNAGGAWVMPEHASKSIYLSKTRISARSPQKNTVPFPEIPKNDPWGKPRLITFGKDGKPVFYREIAILAVPVHRENAAVDTAQIIDVSKYFNPESETLEWKVPPGEWEIQRFVCSNSGENLVLPSKHSAGPIVDHYDADATEFHFTYIIKRLQSVLGDLRKTALKSLYMASYEMKGFTWTTSLPSEFRKINGYNIHKLLPGLFAENAFAPAVQENFRADFQRTLSELMINNFYRKSREICNQYGLKNNSEAGGPGLPLHNVPVEPIKALGSLDIPRGEFWINHNRFNEVGIDILRVVKEVSAASHIYNRRIVEMEAFTSFQQWREGPFEMKPYGDRAFAEGMNKVVVHGSTHNPSGTGYPGIVYHAGTHYNDKRVWWPKIKPFNDYLARISYVLQEADFVADVLFYYGDTIPNYGGHKNSRFTAGPGYDYEIVNTEILKEATSKNRKLVLPRNDAAFSVLALADEQRINPGILLKLRQLVAEGVPVVGAKPETVSGHKHDPEMPHVIEKLWADVNPEDPPAKGGKIYGNVAPSKMLGALNIARDFDYPGSELFMLDYTHYAKDDLDFYFIRNTTNDWISKSCSFRQKNKVPEMWDPASGAITGLSVYAQEGDHVKLPLTLAPYGSIFLVFRPGKPSPRYMGIGDASAPPLLDFSGEEIYVLEPGDFALIGKDEQKVFANHIAVQALAGAWEVFFPAGWGAPERVVFNELESWTNSREEGVKYFSGTATYKKTFQYPVNADALRKKRVYLDLGDLSHVGEVWLNDQRLGIAWAKPYRFDVTHVLKPGDNALVVEIANTWNNRLVGDAVTGKDFARTNITNTNVYGLNHMRLKWEEVPLMPSGLFGPVTLITLAPLE